MAPGGRGSGGLLRVLQSFRAARGPDFVDHLTLPYGVFSLAKHGSAAGPEGLTPTGASSTSIGVAVSPHHILDCRKLAQAPYNLLPECMAEPNLDGLLRAGGPVWAEVRGRTKELLRELCEGSGRLGELGRAHGDGVEDAFAVSHADARMHVPCTIGAFTDFFTSPQHACRGQWERLRPNWKSLPVGYHGRASSVVVGGGWGALDVEEAALSDDDLGPQHSAPATIHRPNGQYVSRRTGRLTFGPSQRLDYEVEVGCIVGGPENALGDPIGSLEDAERRIFGFVLLNDLSARDIQYWEMAPLGPFLGKNFGSVISPWVVPKAAMDERCRRPKGRYPEGLRRSLAGGGGGVALAGGSSSSSPMVPEYLRIPAGSRFHYEYDLPIEVGVRLPVDGRSSSRGSEKTYFPIARTNLSAMHWSFEQLVLHHASNGCNLRAGDLLGSGTLSVASPEDSSARVRRPSPWQYGCLQESTLEGQVPLRLESSPAGGAERGAALERLYLEDGDECVMRGDVFGECGVEILPAIKYERL